MLKRIPRINEFKREERCEKHQDTLANRFAEKEQEEELTSSEEDVNASKEEGEEELPFQDILADKRREYDSTQKYVQLMYNDLAKIFVKRWEGTLLRKSVVPKQALPIPPEEGWEPHPEDEINKVESDDANIEATIESKEKNTLNRQLYKPDANVKIEFVNGNVYTGQISKQKMEGQGTYRWNHGSQYKGAFENNKIKGKGALEWQDCVRYEGDFVNGYYHGKGSMVDKNYDLLYIGEWQKGYKHGKGYCRYKRNDSYDGDWVMDKPEGAGDRSYPDGAHYIGDWRNGLRHGSGTMTWPNGDSYRGEWNQGQMHGYGEYTWDRYVNKSCCWPQGICYMGQWHQGRCNGEGQLTLNSIGGSRYSGGWKENSKHGYGIIIGNNGDVTEGDPLFENNVLLPAPAIKHLPENMDKKNSKEVNGSNPNKFITEATNIPEARITSVLKPEQCPSLRHYIDRLTQAEVISYTRTSLTSLKCRKCEDITCRCLSQTNNQPLQNNNLPSTLLPKESVLNEISSSTTATSDFYHRDGDLPTILAKTYDSEWMKLVEEKRWAYQCIAMHMPRIRQVYDIYSNIFSNESPNCRLSMIRLSLWQLWRDCGIHKTTLSLVQIDRYLATNKCTLMEDPHSPYERIQIWQLIHALLEVSWHLYTKNEDIDKEGYPGRLANGLHKLLISNIYPNAGTSAGILCGPERDLLPIHSVYQLYESIGKPHTARQLLTVIYPTRDYWIFGNASDSTTSLLPVFAAKDFITNGRNSSLGKKPSHLSRATFKPVPPLKTHCLTEERGNLSTHSLLVLRELGVAEFVRIISLTCPQIKDPETDIIINMEYELTLLEFLEIFIEAGKTLVCKRNEHQEVLRMKTEAEETTSMIRIAKGDVSSNSAIRLSGGSKSMKPRKKLTRKL